jgi:hypothetical protein
LATGACQPVATNRASVARSSPRTREAASKLGFTAINASIRVENAGGLAYYSRMGFETYLVEAGDPQAQHRVFNRVHKRFDLA